MAARKTFEPLAVSSAGSGNADDPYGAWHDVGVLGALYA